MIKRTALVVIYNHNFEKNIPKVNKYYEGKFDKIFHLMPFSSYEDDSVIRVEDNSYFFYNFIYQAKDKIAGYDDYIFTGDDCLIHPEITKYNWKKKVGISLEQLQYSYIDNIFNPLSLSYIWNHLYGKYGINTLSDHEENVSYLPDKQIIIKNYIRHYGKTDFNYSNSKFIKLLATSLLNPTGFIKVLISLVSFVKSSNKPNYPFLGGYSDFIIMDGVTLQQFLIFIPIFRSFNIFVEIAIPTILMYIDPNKGYKNFHDKGLAIWDQEEITNMTSTIQKHGVQKLFSGKKDPLFIHPIKLSKIVL